MDGMARERQQYSGDGGHQMHAVHLAFGEPRLPARYLATWSQGLTKEGYFLDAGPLMTGWRGSWSASSISRAGDRFWIMAWGSTSIAGTITHYTGELDALREPYPRLLRFAQYLQGIVGPDGLLPVENIGIPSVWMDHPLISSQRHKQCAFNLYAAAAMEHALAPVCRAFGHARAGGGRRAVWRPALGRGPASGSGAGSADFLSTTCLGWRRRKRRGTATVRWPPPSFSINARAATSPRPFRSLVECPPEMGFSYPSNACWRLWALAKGGRGGRHRLGLAPALGDDGLREAE